MTLTYIQYHLLKQYAERLSDHASFSCATGAAFLWKAIDADCLTEENILRAYFATKSGICELGTESQWYDNHPQSDYEFFLYFTIQLIAYKLTFLGNAGFNSDKDIIALVINNRFTIDEGIKYALTGLNSDSYSHHADMQDCVNSIILLMDYDSSQFIREALNIRHAQR